MGLPTKASKKPRKVAGFRTVPKRQSPGAGALIDVKTVRVLERRYQVLSMRRDGYSIPEIAGALGCGEEAVHRDLTTTLNRLAKDLGETTEQSRQVAVERLESLIKTYTPLAHGHIERVPDPKTGQVKEVYIPPNPTAASLLITLETRRAKLLALDVPEQKEVAASGIRLYVGVNMDLV